MGDKPPSQTLRWDDSIENPTGFSPRNFVDLQRFIACAKVAKLKHGEAAELDEMRAAVMLSPSARVYLAFSHAGALRPEAAVHHCAFHPHCIPCTPAAQDAVVQGHFLCSGWREG